MIPLFKVRMSDKVIEDISPTILSGFITQGPKVEEFEDLLDEYLQPKTRPITTNSCTSAIDLALELCDVDSLSEVISTPQTCFASNVGMIHRNARIRWADIDPDTGLIDPDSVEKLITKNTKAIVAVDWAGRFCDFKKLKSFGVPVIEDAAHVWDVFDTNHVDRGDYIAYSLQAIKFLTSGDGGVLIVPEDKQHRARLLRWFGLDRTKNESFRCTQNIFEAGYKYHMNDIAASIGISNLEAAKESVLSHKKNAEYFCKQFSGLSYAKVLEYDDDCSYWIFPMVLNDTVDRNNFVSYLENNGVVSSPVHFRNDQYAATEKFSEGYLPGVESFTKNQINIPVGWWLSESDINHIVNVIKGFNG